jgi:hypothetical protein
LPGLSTDLLHDLIVREQRQTLDGYGHNTSKHMMNSNAIKRMLYDANGRFIAGLISCQICSRCKHKLIYYYEDYDSYFCASCNKWLAGACGDNASPNFSGNRPPKPLPQPIEP